MHPCCANPECPQISPHDPGPGWGVLVSVSNVDMGTQPSAHSSGTDQIKPHTHSTPR